MADKQLPPQVTMGLLPYLTTHTLDEDYEHVAAKRRTTGQDPAPRKPIGLVGAVIIAAFALLVITAAVQTSRNAGTDEKERNDLVSQINNRKASVASDQRRVANLTLETNRLEAALLNNDKSSSGLLSQIKLLSIRAGASKVRGPGVRVTVDDAADADQNPRDRVLDSDLQKLANGLWQAGAEAMSINGERLTNLSAIRHAGDAITVNFTSLRRPYTVMAIGDPNTLAARFSNTSSGQAWLDLQQKIHLEFNMVTDKSMTLPASGAVTLRYAAKAAGGTQ
ncbi:MAG: hypothetical protein JWR35_1331 [Marmoricola sp.]|nr:hypothetical protein [Marmoricola sp.]